MLVAVVADVCANGSMQALSQRATPYPAFNVFTNGMLITETGKSINLRAINTLAVPLVNVVFSVTDCID